MLLLKSVMMAAQQHELPPHDSQALLA